MAAAETPLDVYIEWCTTLPSERDWDWRERAACRGAGPQRVAMFTCLEDETFDIFGEKLSGYDVQCFLVDTYCRTCPVQWECARWGVEVEEYEAGDRSTGAWAMPRRDRRWLAQHPACLGIIDQAKVDGVPVSEAVADARAWSELASRPCTTS